MKIYSKKILAILLAGTFSLGTTACTEVKEVQVKAITNEENNEKEKIDVVTFEQTKAVRAVENANIRSDASDRSEILGILPQGEILEMVGYKDDWYQVLYNNTNAYIYKDLVTEDFITTTNNKCNKMVYLKEVAFLFDNTREENIVRMLNQYESAQVFYEYNGYYYVMADNNIGFIKKECAEELSGNYAIVDISSQTLNLYQNTDVILTTPVVTGKEKVSDTKIGIHEVYDTRGNRDLVGENGSRSYVDVMMKFYHGQGLHDAEYHTHYDNGVVTKKHGWRDISEFGGSTFIKHGSHGCVNMPHDAAVAVNDVIKTGDKVLVKR